MTSKSNMFRIKNRTNKINLPLLVIFSICFPLSSFAASSENYPNKIGINYIGSNSTFKIISSTEVAVEFDDQETYLDARQEAEDEAIVTISKFIKIMINALKKEKIEPLKIR